MANGLNSLQHVYVIVCQQKIHNARNFLSISIFCMYSGFWREISTLKMYCNRNVAYLVQQRVGPPLFMLLLGGFDDWHFFPVLWGRGRKTVMHMHLCSRVPFYIFYLGTIVIPGPKYCSGAVFQNIIFFLFLTFSSLPFLTPLAISRRLYVTVGSLGTIYYTESWLHVGGSSW